MRVTNEEANAVIKNYEYYFDKTHIVMSESVINTYKYAADLLEARELIKEMRQGLAYINSLNINPKTSALSNTARWGFSSKKAKELLEKTKDYI